MVTVLALEMAAQPRSQAVLAHHQTRSIPGKPDFIPNVAVRLCECQQRLTRNTERNSMNVIAAPAPVQTSLITTIVEGASKLVYLDRLDWTDQAGNRGSQFQIEVYDDGKLTRDGLYDTLELALVDLPNVLKKLVG
jgi:hypothetical protein